MRNGRKLLPKFLLKGRVPNLCAPIGAEPPPSEESFFL